MRRGHRTETEQDAACQRPLREAFWVLHVGEGPPICYWGVLVAEEEAAPVDAVGASEVGVPIFAAYLPTM
jgi:hypothetical protein